MTIKEFIKQLQEKFNEDAKVVLEDVSPEDNYYTFTININGVNKLYAIEPWVLGFSQKEISTIIDEIYSHAKFSSIIDKIYSHAKRDENGND